MYSIQRDLRTPSNQGQTGGRALESGWSPPPTDTRQLRRVTNTLPVFSESIGYLMENDRVDGREKGQWITGTLTY
ncbi:hypothetical protein EVAR_100012_1 [Eumeta japonica]|uniref:Uncharacterized protein n=1 Tax=Eumeta variegata TaxID=151549 RepID=A0A4C1ZPA8_EUMVA|nr:hypothetical protein EVAR_100012_1 [Eumeta japonica]